MSDKLITEAAGEVRVGDAPAREPYRRPVLVPLGSVRDLTLNIVTPTGANDGSSKRRTGRGGLFGSSGCES